MTRPMNGQQAVRAVAPVPGVEMTLKTLATAAHLYAPHLTIGACRSAVHETASWDRTPRHRTGRWLVRVRYGVYTTQEQTR